MEIVRKDPGLSLCIILPVFVRNTPALTCTCEIGGYNSRAWDTWVFWLLSSTSNDVWRSEYNYHKLEADILLKRKYATGVTTRVSMGQPVDVFAQIVYQFQKARFDV